MGWSYARQVKAELGRVPRSPQHTCIWAELFGLGAYTTFADLSQGLDAGNAVVARRAYQIMKWLELSPHIAVQKSRRRLVFHVLPRIEPSYSPYAQGDPVRLCPKAYLRGLFLSRGYLAEPERAIHLEIWLNDAGHFEQVREILTSLKIRPKTSTRRGRVIFYLKDAEQVGRFLAHIGAHRAVLALESAQVVKTLKNQVNRLVNSETANLRRAVESGLEQARILKLLLDTPSHVIPPSLRELALLRIAHPDWSLKELGMALHPPLSKSAVNHRMRRLLHGYDLHTSRES
ncbi:MAG: DNA-binding protein WhiA [Firmicutes bacterium]|nr:DNA-binding protein WhiA [Bacillota bacterium]MCL5015734.1 DNA-binding protein WhiA [Bacillota bacterium]